MEDENIYNLVRKAQENYTDGFVQLNDYQSWSMYKTIQRIDAYLGSVHINGSKDSLGRIKPFFNIVSAAANIWYRATDIDRKDIKLIPQKSGDATLAFLADVLLTDWMIRERFGVFLNTWGRALARYGSAVVKFVQQDGRLIPIVVPWNRLVVDPIDFSSLPVIERIYKTPAQLRKMTNYDQDVVEELITHKQQSRKTLSDLQKDNQDEFIELFEVHGEMPLSFLTDKEKDEDEYKQQMHVISYVQQGQNEFKDFELYKGRESKNIYMLTHLIEEDGRTLSIGAVEYLFDAQWMMNHTIKQQRDYLELASALIWQTADPNLQGRNVLSNIETGAIVIHQQNMPLTQVSNTTMNMPALQAFGQQWMNLSRELTSTPDAMRGNTMPSGTPYSLGALLQQQSGSLFELMTENKGLAIEEMLREYVIPFLKTKMDTSDEVVAILDDYKLKTIDEMFVPNTAVKRAKQKAKKRILSGEVLNQADMDLMVNEESQSLAKANTAQGNQRFFKPSDISSKTWKEVLKDFEWKVRVEVTNEMSDKAMMLQTLSTVMQTIATNPMILQDPNAKMLFNRILSTTGVVSPIELSASVPTPSPNLAPNPVNDGQVGLGAGKSI